MAISFKRSYACNVGLSAPSPSASHCQSTPLLETPGHSLASLGQSLVGSLLLAPRSWCTQGFVCAFQESVSQSWVSSGGSMVGLMATSSKRAYALYSLYHNHVSMLHYSQTETSLLKLILLFLSMYIMHIKNLQWRNEVGK